jgi:hypothetical protein
MIIFELILTAFEANFDICGSWGRAVAKIVLSLNRTTIGKFSLLKLVKHSVGVNLTKLCFSSFSDFVVKLSHFVTY